MQQKFKIIDILVLSFFAVLITFQPYFLHGKINVYETGLYLPGIDAVLKGLVPYRDFFHLRGPFELYMPAAMMAVWGKNIAVLSTYFYIGTVLTLICCVWLAAELYRTRLILYLMVPVLIGRTFPRVVFTYWGGMRYALGILALICAVKFFKGDKIRWVFLGGIVSACGLFTSVEVGICAMIGIIAALTASFAFKIQNRAFVLKSAGAYLLGLLLVVLPYVFYLVKTNSFIPYIESVYAVVVNMQKVIDPHLVSEYPSNLWEALRAMVVPVSKNFRHMTPSYLYIILVAYLVYRWQKRKLSRIDLALLCVGLYGFVIYNTGFRGIWAAQFEMALQPEKILYFFILEEIYFLLKEKRWGMPAQGALSFVNTPRFKAWAFKFFVFVLVGSSVGYALNRYNHRFYAFKYATRVISGKSAEKIRPLSDEKTAVLSIERAGGMVVPLSQADELESMVAFIQESTSPQDIVFTYPELGGYNFFADRPFLGRFPIATFTWFNDDWHKELMTDLNTVMPKVIVVQRELRPDWKTVYLTPDENRRKYDEVMNFISAHYAVARATPESDIYFRKK